LNRALPGLFALTLFLAAGLLFSVQPMVARVVLPRLGGSPAVWTACVLFFQAALLAGYAAAHLLCQGPAVRWQAALWVAALAAAWWSLPVAAPPDSLGGSGDPTAGLLAWLVRALGGPFVAVAVASPVLQKWFSGTDHPAAGDPYFLYSAGNAGSLAALLAYPLVIERWVPLGVQLRAWAVGVGLLAILAATCGAAAAVRDGGPVESFNENIGKPYGIRAWFGWAALAAVPSSLMLGLTTYLTTDLAAVPLLWVVPLSLYLLASINAFARRPLVPAGRAARLLPYLLMVQAPVMTAGLVQPFWLPLHLLTFAAAAVVCQGELAARRPPPSGLTGFYLASAVGGAAGGAFNALVAPRVFDRLVEYPLALVAAALVLAATGGRLRVRPGEFLVPAVVGAVAAALCADVGGVSGTAIGAAGATLASGLALLAAVRHRSRPAQFALTLGALLAAGGLVEGVTGRVLCRRRSFFGTSAVTETGPGGRVHRLFHGSTLHGQQDLDPARRREPLTYFTRSGPVGQVFDALDTIPRGGRPARVGVTGVGAGSLAGYARPGQRWTFFEIDPDVVDLARDPRYFTYLADSPAATLDVVLGDARVALAGAADGAFDLLILDAFSSDAIPAHLLTRESLALYRRKLAARGLVALNVTNRYLDLPPVVARLAADAAMVCRVRVDAPANRAEAEAWTASGKQGSIWAVLAADLSDIGPIAADPRWYTPAPRPGDPVWTDGRSSLLDHLRPFGGVRPGR